MVARRPALANDALHTDVVRSLDELMQAFALRSATYIAEQDCPYLEEFDGNDLAASHFVTWSGPEPVATCRVRWFRDFVKLERVCILPAHRGGRVVHELLNFTFEFCARKGYRRMLAQAQRRYAEHWKAMGHRLLEDRAEFRFSDHAYVTFEVALPEISHPLTFDADPYLINRPEGRWDEPGVLDRSAARVG